LYNHLATLVAALGFKGILCEGVERLLKGRTINKIYTTPDANTKLLLRNAALSDDIAFRFGEEGWDKHPPNAEKFAEWIRLHKDDTEVINLFMDYETFGIHKKKETGIFDFVKALPQAVLSNGDWKFSLPSEAIEEYAARDVYHIQKTISWEDRLKECCVWCENMMQNNTLKKIYSIEKMVLHHNTERVLETWGRLQCADYFYYMAESDCAHNQGRYSNPHETPQMVFEYYNNIMTDFEISLIKR
jgi:alpha-amylase